ncbi:16S rRNA (guanine(966)-N(2))-methyltransferase RsmD [bacterium]|nr:16S rRNA (guanine(966)-N(2))-methyltransferase RsmD [bacterium]
MRVIAGKSRGIELKGAKGKDFRPTTQLVKGSVFDHLQGEIEGSFVLDLFAGSGGLGIEALSRGAAKGVFVDISRNAIEAIKLNIKKCGFGSGQVEIVRSDVIRFLNRAVSEDEVYDIIFADPPYKSNFAMELLRIINETEKRICGIMVIESSEEINSVNNKSMQKYKVKKFGHTYLNYFKYIRS